MSLPLSPDPAVLACLFARLQVSDYWRMVIEINDYQKSRYVERVIKSMFNTVSKKKIAVGGAAGEATVVHEKALNSPAGLLRCHSRHLPCCLL